MPRHPDPAHGHPDGHPHAHPHAHGLSADLERWFQRTAKRRRAMNWLLAGGTAGVLAACGGNGDDDTTATSGSTSGSGGTSGGTTGGSSGTTTCSVAPTETAGPYPADGSLASSQRLNALVLAGIARSDIRTSVAGASGTAAGVPMTLTITLVNTNGSCASLAGYAVYAWHCTRDGNYSLYSTGHTGENYLRGVQVTDAKGQLTFTTIFPGCYSGRWPHIHFEVYPSLTAATDATAVSDYSKVSQIALPEDVCRTVYGSATGYGSSLTALNGISLASDNVFSDGHTSQMATVTGSVSGGYAASITVGIAA